MVGENWDVFTKRVLIVEKHISDIPCENPEKISLPTPLNPQDGAFTLTRSL